MKKRLTGAVIFTAILFTFAVVAWSPMLTRAAGSSESVEADGVTITIETNKSRYRAGEEIQYTIIIDNQREKWDIAKTSFTYTNTQGLMAAEDGSMPMEIPQVLSGESVTLTGTLVGDPDVFTGTGDLITTLILVAVAVVVVVVIVVVALLLRKKKSGTKAAVFLLAAVMGGLTFSALHLPAQAAVGDTVVLRPYVQFKYAGEDVMIRAVIELKMNQQLLAVEPEDRLTYQKVTCHDPSIFRDKDGTYYIFGSFLAAGRSENLYNWTSIDASFQSSFTEGVRSQIRAWNKDETAGNWNDYLWAPDIVYNPVLGKYCIYLSANGDDWKSNIVLLTADNVEGPYEYAGTIVYGGFNAEDYGQTDAPLVLGEDEIPERYVTHGVVNRKWGDKWPNCIDPCVFYDDDGNLWMSYGSWSGGIFMLELDENTGLRDYSVSYETNQHSDAYFGKKIAGGAYVSGEASYIQKIGNYYYLFISYGNLEAAGGYNVRIFRSENPDGEYVDLLGNSSYYDTYLFNYNQSVGVRLFGGYKWRNFNSGMVAQGHNSAFVDEDGRAYIVFHTRMDNGTEGHYVKVHQLFTTKEGWIVAAPYQTTGEALAAGGATVASVAGDYEVILHELDIDYKNLETKKPVFITLTEDGQITGDYEGSWSIEEGTSYITLILNGKEYSGVTLPMQIEYTTIETQIFTAVGLDNQVTVWGSKAID